MASMCEVESEIDESESVEISSSGLLFGVGVGGGAFLELFVFEGLCLGFEVDSDEDESVEKSST